VRRFLAPVVTLVVGSFVCVSADTVADQDECGAGQDTLTADAHDVYSNCETVHLTP
jgi:hypothetical protein